MSNSVRFGGGAGGVSEFASIAVNTGGIDCSAYLGGVLICRTVVMSRTGGNCCGGANCIIYGWNGSSWVTICSSAVGGSTSDAYLWDADTAIITDNPYSQVKYSISSWSNAYGSGSPAVVGGK